MSQTPSSVFIVVIGSRGRHGALHLLGATGLVSFSLSKSSLEQIFRETEQGHVMFYKSVKITPVFMIFLICKYGRKLKDWRHFNFLL